MEKEIQELKYQIKVLQYQVSFLSWQQNFSQNINYPNRPMPEHFGLDSTTLQNTYTVSSNNV